MVVVTVVVMVVVVVGVPVVVVVAPGHPPPKQEEPGNPKANQPHSPWHVDPVVFRLKGPKENQDLSFSQLGNQPQNRW